MNRLINKYYLYDCEEFEMFKYNVLLNHVARPANYLTLDIMIM